MRTSDSRRDSRKDGLDESTSSFYSCSWYGGALCGSDEDSDPSSMCGLEYETRPSHRLGGQLPSTSIVRSLSSPETSHDGDSHPGTKPAAFPNGQSAVLIRRYGVAASISGARLRSLRPDLGAAC